MRNTKEKYSEGYKGKLDYWNGVFSKALLDGDYTLRNRAAEKLNYFNQKQIEWEAKQPNVLKFWCESSYDFEDKEREGDEELIIAVDMGEDGTKTIGRMEMSSKETVETLLCIINLERFGS